MGRSMEGPWGVSVYTDGGIGNARKPYCRLVFCDVTPVLPRFGACSGRIVRTSDKICAVMRGHAEKCRAEVRYEGVWDGVPPLPHNPA